MPGLSVKRPGPNGTAFAIEPDAGYSPTPAESTWIGRLSGMLGELADLDRSKPPPDATKLRDKLATALENAAQTICAMVQPGRDGAIAEGLRDLDYQRGAYLDRIAQFNAAPFVVSLQYDPANPGRIIDLVIQTRDVDIPADKQQFKVTIDQAVTVVKTVFSDDSDDATGNQAGLAKLAAKVSPAPAQASIGRSNDYFRSLFGIAGVGLTNMNSTQTPFAVLALTGFKNEFVAREGGRIKNRYVRRLGLNALIALLIASACYVATISMLPTDATIYRFRNFFVLAAAASVGTWLSFAIRRQVLGFEDLATLEDDRLNPGIRVLFMIALTTVVGLIFWTGMATVKVGDFRTDFQSSGSWAALVGALCGIAERSLTTAVSRRASELVSSIGGTAKT